MDRDGGLIFRNDQVLCLFKPYNPSGGADIGAAGLFAVRNEIGNGNLWTFFKVIQKIVKDAIQHCLSVFGQLHGVVGQPSSFPDGGIVSSQGGEGGELGGSVCAGHMCAAVRDVVGKTDDIIVAVGESVFVLQSDSPFQRLLCLVSANLIVALDGGGTVLQIHSAQNGVLAVFAFDTKNGLLSAALFGKCFGLLLLTFIVTK